MTLRVHRWTYTVGTENTGPHTARERPQRPHRSQWPESWDVQPLTNQNLFCPYNGIRVSHDKGSSDAGCNLTSLEGVRRKSSKTQKTANRIILCTCRVPERQTPRGEGGRKASGGMGSGRRGYGESLGVMEMF